jgi:hypothetical protein
MPRAKAAKAKKISKKAAEHDASEARERKTAEKVMETVLQEQTVEQTAERIDQWVPIECPHCGESTEIHVTQEEDGQSLDQDCTVCCRSFVAHVEIEEGEAVVNVEAS